MKKISIKIFITLIIMALLETCVLSLSEITFLMSQLKIEHLKPPIIYNGLENGLKHPITLIKTLKNAKNPIFIIGTGAVVLFSLYVFYKLTTKKDYKLATDYAVHGSSRYASNKEIFVEKETVAIPIGNMMKDLEMSMGGKNNGTVSKK